LRHDQWSAEDLERIRQEGAPQLDSSDPVVLAAQLRAHTWRDGHYYIELEPNLELAQRILKDPAPEATPEQAPELEGRRVFGSDTRTLWGGSFSSTPASAVGFNNTSGSGVKIAQHAIYTAAHVVFESFGTSEGWYCSDGSHSFSCSALASWRFGVNGTSGFTSWLANGCFGITIPNAYVALSGSPSIWDRARWDYAAIDTTGCSDGNTGWLGTSPVNDQTLLSMTGHSIGYPARATCPANSTGLANYPGDCPGTGASPGSTWQRTGNPGTEPYTGAKLWYSTASDLAPGDSQGAFTIKSTIDVTHGNSGGPMYQLVGSSRYVVGNATGHNSSWSVFSRWTGEVHNFMNAYSPFPQP
jgi:V8-like Glu-specific endopeptidase